MARRTGLLRSVARTTGRAAIISGTATAVSGSVAHRQQQKFARQSEPVSVAPAPPPAAAPQVSSPGGSDLVVRLQLLADLRGSGALTEEEFTLAKSKLLHG